jgi:hypothetical protein
MALFDSFPPAQQQRQIETWIVPGAIVYLYCPWVMKAYKEKYLVIGATQPECLLFMVNTDARRIVAQTQVSLYAANYAGMLASDCFVNCNRVETQITYHGVKQQIAQDGSRYRGKLSEGDQQQVVAAIKHAQDISPVHQDMLYAALDEAA